MWTRSVEMNRKANSMARDKAGKVSTARDARGQQAAGRQVGRKGGKYKKL